MGCDDCLEGGVEVSVVVVDDVPIEKEECFMDSCGPLSLLSSASIIFKNEKSWL